MKLRIPIKKYTDDPSLSWEERYALLLRHHEEETKLLIEHIEVLERREEDRRPKRPYMEDG